MKFLSDTDAKGRGENILASVVRMAKWLNMPVIAEGVEKEEQVQFLKSIGCEYVQGYYYARPMPIADYEKLAYEDSSSHMSENGSSTNRDKDVLWNSTAQIENLFSNMMQAIAVVEYDGQKIDITRVNNAYYDLFGYGDMGHGESEFMDTVDSIHKDQVMELFKMVSAQKAQGECEFIRVLDSGRTLWVNMNLKYMNRVGTRDVIFATLYDITEQKKVDLELQKYRSAINATHKDRETILVVDDEEVNRVVLKCIFEKEYNIVEAANGKEALECLEKNKDIGLILLDIMMPVMDGPSFLKAKNKISDINSIPVIIINADETTKQQVETLAMGASDYIVKLFIPEIVIRRVNNVMDSNRKLGAYLEKAGMKAAVE